MARSDGDHVITKENLLKLIEQVPDGALLWPTEFTANLRIVVADEVVGVVDLGEERVEMYDPADFDDVG